jgi:hypothetical protein
MRGPKVAFSGAAGSVLIAPMQLGPISRIPYERQMRSSSD